MLLFSLDFAEPLTMPGYGGATSAGASVFGATGLDNQPPEEIIAIITSMGFHRNQAIQALRATVSMRDCGQSPPLTGVACISSVAIETFQCPLGHACLALYPTMDGPQKFICI